MDGVTSLIREKWQPACLAGNLKSIRYKRALTSALVKYSLKSHIFIFLLVLNSVNRNRRSYVTDKGKMAACMLSGKFKINKIYIREPL